MAIHKKRCEGCCDMISTDDIRECDVCGELYCVGCMEGGEEDSTRCEGCFEDRNYHADKDILGPK